MGKILFHHIPKTGGTTLISNAHRLFGGAVCSARYDYQLSDDMIGDDQFVFYHGHFTREAILRFRSHHPAAFIFTLVRHPFNRTLSQYYNWTDKTKVNDEFETIRSRTEDNDHIRSLRDKFNNFIFGLSLEDFLCSADPDIRQVTENLQSRYMTSFVESPDHVRFNKTVLNAITTYDFIGIQELYPASLRIIEAKCGLPTGSLGGERRENTTGHAKAGGKYHISRQELALLEARNVYDMALFHLCYALLLRDHAEHLPSNCFDIDDLADLPVVTDLT